MDSSKHAWWQLVQGAVYPNYVTCVNPKKFAPNPKKLRQQVQELAVDDVLDANSDPDHWRPATFTLKAGTCALALPPDADSAGKATVSQPYMARISAIYFVAALDDKGKRMDAREPQNPEAVSAEAKVVLAWERKQLQDNRIAVAHFQLEMNYFYRMSDFKGPEALEAKGHGVQNNKVLCKALTTLGVVDSITAAERLVSDRKSGQSKASRLLNRFVAFSTHMGKLQDDADDDADATDEADDPLPLESVFGTCKVWYLGAKESLPYMHAPVATAAEQGNQRGLPARKRAALQAELQEQHQELPPGFFCNLIYIKQTGQLLTLEGWADGTAGNSIRGDWVQPSRWQARELLEQSKRELKRLQKQSRGQAGSAGTVTPSDEQAAAAAAAAAGTPAELLDSDWDHDDEASKQQHGHKPAAAARQQQKQKRTPRKSAQPRQAQLQQQLPSPRRRLRTLAQAAGKDADAGSGDDSDVVLISSDDDSKQQGGSQQDAEEAEVLAPQRKKQRTAAAAAAAAAAGVGSASEGASDEDEDAMALASGSSSSDADTSSQDETEQHVASSADGLDDDDDDAGDETQQEGGAGPSRKATSQQGSRQAAAAAGRRTAPSGRDAAAAEAVGGRQQTPRVHSSKQAVLGRRT